MGINVEEDEYLLAVFNPREINKAWCNDLSYAKALWAETDIKALGSKIFFIFNFQGKRFSCIKIDVTSNAFLNDSAISMEIHH